MTTPNDSRDARRLLAEALLRDPEERDEFLDLACADQQDLKVAVKALLAEHRPSQSGTSDHRHRSAAAQRVVGSYVIRQELGRGGMGVVYLADDTRLLRRVALKALAPDIVRDPASRERLRREARAAAALSHPGIATVYALEEIGDELFLACEYVPGPPLRHVLLSGPLPIRDVIQMSAQLARALAAAHAQGVVHRDLKPENIIRTPAGTAKILDFGLARMDGLAASRLTQTGAVVGTPAYMSPEQATDVEVDFRTDIFSLGLLMYEMAAGVNPFEAKTLSATLSLRLVNFDPPSLAAAIAGCPQDLDRIVARCLRKDPLQRYETTEHLVDELTRLELVLTPPHPVPFAPPVPAPGTDWWKAHIAIVSALYAGMIYPAWYIGTLLPGTWGTRFLLTLVVAAAAAVTLRLHLWFTHYFDVDELVAQQARSGPWVKGFDTMFSLTLLAAGVGIADAHRGWALLLIVVGVVTLIAAFVIEPLTTRSAFRRSGRISNGAKPNP